MLKQIKFDCLSLFILFTIPSYAYVPHKVSSTELIYCPEKIVCDTAGKLSSCRTIGADAQYWSKIEEEGRIEKGDYSFTDAKSSYQYPMYAGSSCRYTNKNNGIIKSIKLFNYIGFNSEAYLGNEYAWYVDGYLANCSAEVNTKCPLVEKDEVFFDVYTFVSKNHVYGEFKFDLSANNIFIKNNSIDNVPQLLFSLNRDDIEVACGSVSMCKIDISSINSGGNISGSILLDLNSMKILYVMNDLKSTIKMKKEDPFNTIQFN